MVKVPNELWSRIPRHLITSGQIPLAPLVVVSAPRGWGKTVWMHQYQDFLVANRQVECLWPTNRTELELILATSDNEPRAIFADAIVTTVADPLWEAVYQYLTNNPDSVVIASGVDRIPHGKATEHHALEVFEPHLAFSRAEVRELLDSNNITPTEEAVEVLAGRLRGRADLVRYQVEQWQGTSPNDKWVDSEGPTEQVLDILFESFGPSLKNGSTYLKMIRDAAAFRRFDVTMVSPPDEESTDVLGEQFERLIMSPIGRYELDPQTGRDTFEWNEATWRSLRTSFPERATAQARREAFDRTIQAGAITTALFYLLESKAYSQADSYVDRHLRLFMLYTDEIVVRQLLSLPTSALKEHPNLAILTAELLTRRGEQQQAQQAFHSALAKLQSRLDGDVRIRFRTLTREAFCRVSLGDRAGASHRLDSLLDLLGTEGDAGPILVSAVADPETAATLSDELYLSFWTAIQIDRHREAVHLARLMTSWLVPGSQTALATTITAATEEIFAGFTPSVEIPAVVGHTDALLLLEEGRGDEALELVEAMSAHRSSSPTRSAAEALILTVRALQAPNTLTVDSIMDPVERSMRFWTDGKPSPFIAQSASFAFLAIQRPDLAQSVLSALPESDWHVSLALAIERLDSGEAGQALGILTEMYQGPEAPRASSITDALSAAAYSVTGQDEAARARLVSMWMDRPPRLIRYAMRFVPQIPFLKLLTYRDQLPAGIVEILELASTDPHVLKGTEQVVLTPRETDTLALLSQGATYAQIADARQVSLNTVRSQVKNLYRKLGVKGRAEAIAMAGRLKLTE